MTSFGGNANLINYHGFLKSKFLQMLNYFDAIPAAANFTFGGQNYIVRGKYSDYSETFLIFGAEII